MGQRQLNPDIENHSALMAQEAADFWGQATAKARAIIAGSLEKHAIFYTSLVDQDISPEEASVYKLKADVARGNLKLGGLESETINHTGKVAFEPFVLSREGNE